MPPSPSESTASRWFGVSPRRRNTRSCERSDKRRVITLRSMSGNSRASAAAVARGFQTRSGIAVSVKARTVVASSTPLRSTISARSTCAAAKPPPRSAVGSPENPSWIATRRQERQCGQQTNRQEAHAIARRRGLGNLCPETPVGGERVRRTDGFHGCVCRLRGAGRRLVIVFSGSAALCAPGADVEMLLRQLLDVRRAFEVRDLSVERPVRRLGLGDGLVQLADVRLGP